MSDHNRSFTSRLFPPAALVFGLVAFLGSLLTQQPGYVAGLGGGGIAGASYVSDDTATYSWVDACIEGTALEGLAGQDDAYQSDVPVGFTFSFAGNKHTVVEVTSNGVISLDQEGNGSSGNEALPTTQWASAALFPWWDNLNITPGQVCYAHR